MDKEQIEKLIEETRKEESDFRSIMPSSGFLGAYMAYTDRQESPGSYHFWVAVTIISAVLQRRVWIDKGIYEVYPNLYTILVGPSGQCRKSRAMALGTELLDGFEWANVIADKTSPEALLQALQVGTATMERDGAPSPTGGVGFSMNHDAAGLVLAPELAVFINKQTYMTGMVSILTTLFDSPPSFKYITRNKRPIVLKRISLSLLGASTPDWIATNLPSDAFGGGFMSRMIFIVKQRRDRHIPLPENPAPHERDNLRAALLQMHTEAKGAMLFSPAGKKWFNDWYNSVESVPVSDTSLLGFIERKPDTVLKVAMILAICDKRIVVTETDLRQSHMIVSWTQERMFSAFSHVDLSPIGIIQRRIMEMLDHYGQVTRGEVLRKLGGRLQHGVSDLEQIEKLLIEAGLIEKSIVHTGQKGRPTILYRRTEQKE